MALGFFAIEFDAPLARRLRTGFNSLWGVAEIVLFVLLGASVQIDVLENALLPGLLLLAAGTLIGRSVGWYQSTVGSQWTLRERLFLLPGNSAKATVQAAIGAIPLAQGIEGGEVILAIAALSILVTAPLGAWAIPTFAPKLLTRGEVDPTKVAVVQRIVLLAAVDSSGHAAAVLSTAAEMARNSEAKVIVCHVVETESSASVKQLRLLARRLLADIRYEFKAIGGVVPEEILNMAQRYGANKIVIGKQGQHFASGSSIGSVSSTVLEMSLQPVLIVTAEAA